MLVLTLHLQIRSQLLEHLHEQKAMQQQHRHQEELLQQELRHTVQKQELQLKQQQEMLSPQQQPAPPSPPLLIAAAVPSGELQLGINAIAVPVARRPPSGSFMKEKEISHMKSFVMNC